MSNAVVSGVGRHSLGEAFLKVYSGPRASVVGIDRIENPFLLQTSWLRQCIFDLNPLNFPGSAASFAESLSNKLESCIPGENGRSIHLLVQCAGVYDYSQFLKSIAEVRSGVIGLNVLGVTELLHAVMSLNAKWGLRNDTVLTHVLVGSSQGLYARTERAVYAASKAFSIDLCTSLVDGGELARCVYLAVGPIDTPMMHRNHWVNKVGGSEAFFDRVLGGDASTYKSIFIDCNDSAVELTAKKHLPAETAGLLKTMVNYRMIRRRQFDKESGVLSPAKCADCLVQIISKPELGSGVLMIRPKKNGEGESVRFASFWELSRRRLFDSVCRAVT